MGVRGYIKYVKYLLLFFNFIFLLAGVVILGVAVRWRQVLNAQIAVLDSQQKEVENLNMFYICLMATGTVMMVVSFLGCYATIQESQCLLGTFLACLVLLFACDVAAGIWGYMNKDALLRETTNFYDSIYDRFMKPDFYDQGRKTLAKSLLLLHETLQCCGKRGTDLFTILSQAAVISEVCPSSLITVSCHDRINELVLERFYPIGIFALVIAVITCGAVFWDPEKPGLLKGAMPTK